MLKCADPARDRNAASRARPNAPADFALLLKIVSRVEPGRSRLLQRTCAGDEPRTIRLFGRRHYRLSDIWSRHYGTFARYGASLTGPLRVSIGPFHKAFGTAICQGDIYFGHLA